MGSPPSPSRAGRAGDSQPIPIHHEGQGYVQEAVMDDIERRMQLGIERYGTGLQINNGRRALVDLYEELLDAVCYLKQLIMEEEANR